MPVGRGSCTGTRRATIRTRPIAPIRPRAQRIAQELAAFGRIRIGRSVAYGAAGDAYGLVDPEAIIVLFTNDQAGSPLDFAVGDRADGLGRYLQMPDHMEIVAVPDDQITGLIDLAAELEP